MKDTIPNSLKTDIERNGDQRHQIRIYVAVFLVCICLPLLSMRLDNFSL